MMALSDTVDMMISDNYRQRFRAEYLQNRIRYEKLKTLCNRITAARLDGTDEPKHDCPFDLLVKQMGMMREYIELLEVRAIIEDIYIGDIEDGVNHG